MDSGRCQLFAMASEYLVISVWCCPEHFLRRWGRLIVPYGRKKTPLAEEGGAALGKAWQASGRHVFGFAVSGCFALSKCSEAGQSRTQKCEGAGFGHVVVGGAEIADGGCRCTETGVGRTGPEAEYVIRIYEK